MKYSGEQFSVFPALGYWEIDGRPVSSKEAMAGLHPRAIWKQTEVMRRHIWSADIEPATPDGEDGSRDD